MTSSAARRRAAIVVAGLLAAIATAAGLLAALGGASNGPTAADSFKALRRPMNTHDKGLTQNPHFQRFASGLPSQYQPKPSEARIIGDANGVLLTLMPTAAGGFCQTAAVSNNGVLTSEVGLCSYGPRTTPHLNDTPVVNRAGDSRSAHRPWVGVVPDGVSNFRAIYSDGSSEVAPLTADRGFVLDSSKEITAFSYTDSSGQAHTVAAGTPPPS